MKKQILLSMAFVPVFLASVACHGNSEQNAADSICQSPQDSLQVQSSVDSLALQASNDSVVRAERTAAEIELITKFYNSKLIEQVQELRSKKELSVYCSDGLLEELRRLYKSNPDLMDGDPTDAYATYAFTGGVSNGYDAPDYRPIQVNVEPSGEHTYVVSYKHMGKRSNTELKMTSDGSTVKIDRIVKRAW